MAEAKEYPYGSGSILVVFKELANALGSVQVGSL